MGLNGKIGIVVDSAADLPEGMVEAFGIHVLPVHIFVDGRDHLHGVTIHNKDVVAHLKRFRKVHTSPYFPSECADFYEKLLFKYEKLISFHVSTELSGNYQSALNSINLLMEEDASRITVIDSGNVSIGQGLFVKRAVEYLSSDPDVNGLEKSLDLLKKYSFFCFTVDNLIWLKQGGRVSAFSAFVGSMLNIKPIISLKGARLIPVEKHRGRQSSIKRLIQMASEKYKHYRGKCDIWVAHVDALDDAIFLSEELSVKMGLDLGEIEIVDIGATIAVHAGPGGLCIAMMPK